MNSSAFYVLLDLDGVIINTEDQYSEYWDCMARRYLPHPEGFAARIKGQTTEMILSHYPQELSHGLFLYTRSRRVPATHALLSSTYVCGDRF